ncbi:hypothetical protein [Microcoleus sp. CAWBG52]|uniref:hypothetical protein n=1 Tax=Microcoleus sp. CAWBG52 TaxID=2841649 RepID=UPI0025EE3F58|nr:hypothetical protein [Microcoleus sp. CAWBG52]
MSTSVGCREVFRKKPGFWGPAIGFFVDGAIEFFCGWAIAFLGGWAIAFLGGWAIGFFVEGRSGFWLMGAIGYNTENLTTKTTVMRELIQQELEKFDREQLQQVFEFIAFLKFRARLVTIPAIDETNLAALYSEFAEEDRQLAELGISEYSELLKHEDLSCQSGEVKSGLPT